MKTLDNDGLYKIVKALKSNGAEAKVIIGHAKSPEDIHYFEGSIKGKIVAPRGENGFGWDPIFEIEKLGKTFAELTQAEKNKISMRKLAFTKLKTHLEENS